MIAMVYVHDVQAAIEQLDNPDLKGRPVVVLQSDRMAIPISVSAEAQARGLHIGMSWDDIRQTEPACAHVIARPDRYHDISARIMQALREVAPEVEAHSTGSAFMDLTSSQAYYRHDPDAIGRLAQTMVHAASGLDCSVGISGDKTTARWAAQHGSRHGITLVPPASAADYLGNVPLTALCHISSGMTGFFAEHGIHLCGDMKKIPVSLPAHRFGDVGRTLWLMAQGRDPSPIDLASNTASCSGVGKILPPDTVDPLIIQMCLRQLADKLALQLRRQGQLAHRFHFAIRCQAGWRHACMHNESGLADGAGILKLAKRFLRLYWFGEPVLHIRMYTDQTATGTRQSDLFP
jgi:DNA polymerase-4